MSRKTREQTSTHTSFVVAYTNSTGFDEAHLRLSPYDHWLACSSHTDESESKPSHAPRGIFTPDALPVPTPNPPNFRA